MDFIKILIGFVLGSLTTFFIMQSKYEQALVESKLLKSTTVSFLQSAQDSLDISIQKTLKLAECHEKLKVMASIDEELSALAQ